MTAEEHQYRFETLQVHGGQKSDPATKARAVPIYATTSFQFTSVQDAEEALTFKKEAFLYTRYLFYLYETL
jgi:O-acetylhomoserine (thiol)-lyase